MSTTEQRAEMTLARKLWIIFRSPIKCFILRRWTRNADYHYVGLVNGQHQIQLTPKVKKPQ